MPSNPNGDITAYEAQFYIPGTENGRLVEIAQSRTFYIVKEEDKLGGDTSTFVRVCHNNCSIEDLFAPSYVMVIIIFLRCVQSQEQEVVNGVMVNV